MTPSGIEDAFQIRSGKIKSQKITEDDVVILFLQHSSNFMFRIGAVWPSLRPERQQTNSSSAVVRLHSCNPAIITQEGKLFPVRNID